MNENRILLVGNGINDAQKISWNDMLNFIQDKLIAEGKIKEKEKIVAGQTSVSPTLLFDSLCKKNDVNEEILRELVKNYVENKSNFVKKLWGLYDIILTTNFDANLIVNIKGDETKKLTSNLSPLYRYITFNYENTSKKLYFIHGYHQSPETICLGLNQYTENLQKIRSHVLNLYPLDAKKTVKNASGKKSKTAWVSYFFKENTTVDILGLNLCPEEIDLWWLLTHRNKYFQNNSTNIVRYFDLEKVVSEDDNKRLSDRKTLLQSFGVKIEEIKNTWSYNSDFYSLCLKKIREINAGV